jgi:hypothetical protein
MRVRCPQCSSTVTSLSFVSPSRATYFLPRISATTPTSGPTGHHSVAPCTRCTDPGLTTTGHVHTLLLCCAGPYLHLNAKSADACQHARCFNVRSRRWSGCFPRAPLHRSVRAVARRLTADEFVRHTGRLWSSTQTTHLCDDLTMLLRFPVATTERPPHLPLEGERPRHPCIHLVYLSAACAALMITLYHSLVAGPGCTRRAAARATAAGGLS